MTTKTEQEIKVGQIWYDEYHQHFYIICSRNEFSAIPLFKIKYLSPSLTFKLQAGETDVYSFRIIEKDILVCSD